MIAESRPEEKEMMISVIMNCLQEINRYTYRADKYVLYYD